MVTLDIFGGGGPLDSQMRERFAGAEDSANWLRSQLGAIASWSLSLKTTLNILLNADTPMLLVWGNDRLVFYNDAYQVQLHHHQQGLPLGRSWQPPQTPDWAAMHADIEQVFVTGHPLRRENQRFPAGDRRSTSASFSWSYSAVGDETGAIAGVVVTSSQAAAAINSNNLGAEDLQQAETALRHSEERYQALFDSIGQGFCVIELLFDAADQPIDYRFLEVNPAFEHQTGLTDALGKRLRELVAHPRADLLETYGKVARSGISQHFENYAEALHRWYDVYAFRIGQPDHGQVAILFDDISDRKRAEEAVREQTNLMQVILDSVGDGLILANCEGGFVLFNQAAERLFGRLSNERSHQEWSKTYGLFLPDQQTLFPNHQLPLYRAMQGEDATDVEVFVRRDPAAQGRWVSISGFPVRGINHEITGGVITCRDISDRKQIEADLRESDARRQFMLDASQIGDWGS